MATETPGSIIGRFSLVERLGSARSSVWRADDDKGRRIVLKILARTLPTDPARRNPLIQKIRQRAAIRHLGLAAIEDVIVEGDVLLLQLENVEGQGLMTLPGPWDSPRLMRLIWQLADTLGYLHGRGIVHGELTTDSVVLNAEGDARVLGLGLGALAERPDRGEERLLQSTRATDIRELGFRAPEQITHKGLDGRSDLFALGVVLYEVATGTAPFVETTSAETAAAVLGKSPRPPHELNPKLPLWLASLLGRCLQKDPFKRFADAKALLEELRRGDPAIATAAARTLSTFTRTGGSVRRSETIFIVGVLPYFSLLQKTNSAKASSLAARMHQVLGEAVLLVDGTILDSLGERFVASLPDGTAAIAALRHAFAETAEQNASRVEGDRLEPTILAHTGELVTTGGTPAGTALDAAGKVLERMEPGQILLSEPVAAQAGIAASARRVGAIEGIELFAMPSVETAAEEVEPDPAPVEPAPATAPLAPVAAQQAARKKPPLAWIAAAAAGITVLAVVTLFLLRSDADPDGVPAVAAASQPVTTESGPPEIFIEPFAVEGSDPQLLARASAVEESVRRLLDDNDSIRIASKPSPDARQFGARTMPGGAPGELGAYSTGAGEGPRVSLAEPGMAAAEIARWIASQSGLSSEQVASSSPEAMAAFVEAIEAARASDPQSRARTLAALRRALTADPAFVAAARLALPMMTAAGDRQGAMTAAAAILASQPNDIALRRQLFAWLREEGDVATAVRYAVPLASTEDPDILLFLGRQALSAGDAAAFQRMVGRLQSAMGAKAPLHTADLIAAQGRFGVAVQQYYTAEPNEPENADLALKIGRIGVLRHSLPVAELELEKLQRLDPRYGAPLLRAFIAAEKRDPAGARAALQQARAGATPDDDFHTASAEVHAMLSDHGNVLASIRSAVDAREPAFAYILANPLFSYLTAESSFAPLRGEMERVQAQVRTELASVK